MKDELYYLASPYSHKESGIRDYRYRKTLIICDIISQRYNIAILSPIVYGHQFAKFLNYPTDASYWMEFNLILMNRSDYLIVLQLDGWEHSIGIAHEIAQFKGMDKRIGYINEQEVQALQRDKTYKPYIRTQP